MHAVLICNLILPARDKDGKKLNKTKWENHFGVKPRVQDFLLGPWGCLAYLILTAEQRKARKLCTHFGVRAIGGIYLGTVCNPVTHVYKHLISDGRSMFSTASNRRYRTKSRWRIAFVETMTVGAAKFQKSMAR